MCNHTGSFLTVADHRGLMCLFVFAVPFNRLWNFDQSMRQHLVHHGDWYDLQTALYVVWNLGKVLGILLRDQHLLDAAPQCRQQLLLQTTDRQIRPRR